ncbi:uncharacterized protein BHQ10_002240 [Talaromyces amestolkiae]|uniref:C2H2-type domain-containing protein n=1 Tax=Talaromyces amestolkiae TaxID=1196081 RepID=A0A364KRQ0_TALAM|nr:uncharacterized protein BHQ10_002240 [Talaromyces amestolkiae]RAO66228.1 hypothetical protein BHQ10_002240 [Talaromyces amestolkiae]
MYECDNCSDRFHSRDDLDEHMDVWAHWECETCSRTFGSQHSRNQHMNAIDHWAKRYGCETCAMQFRSEIAAEQHMEVNGHYENYCKDYAPFLNREKILRIVRRQDPNGLITNKQIEWHKEQTSEYEVTDQAYNGNAWECYLCHRQFQMRQGLTQHLNSPVHKQQVYHCPNFKCPKQFVTLAALFNHLESEQCEFMKFQSVQKHVHGIVTGQRLISF